MLYVVMATVTPGITVKDVQDALGPVTNSYYRIAPNVWLIHSSIGARGVSEHIQPLCVPGGAVFVSRLDINDRWGYLGKQVWDWITKWRGV